MFDNLHFYKKTKKTKNKIIIELNFKFDVIIYYFEKNTNKQFLK